MAHFVVEKVAIKWKVVGGGDKGGILVREGKDTKSKMLTDRLATNSEVLELELDGDRLKYKRLTGAGPTRGWVSIKLKDSPLMVEIDNEGNEIEPSKVKEMREAPPPAVATPAKAKAPAAPPPAAAPAPATEAPAASAPPASPSAAPVVNWKPPPPNGRKLRVVCLHGTACSEKIFKMQLSKLIPKVKDVEFIFVDGEVKIEAGPAFETMQKFFGGLPNRAYDEVRLDKKGWRSYKDPQVALDYLQTQLKAHAPVDGLMGFSQGANFCVMLAAQAAAGVGVPIGFSVLLCPNAPGYAEQLPELFTERKLPMPVLISRGEQEGYGAGMEPVFDALQKDGAFELVTDGLTPAGHVANLCGNAEMIAHPGGHQPLPSKKDDVDKMVEKVTSFLAEQAK